MKYRIHGMFFASSMGIRLAIALCCALLGVRVQLAQDAGTGSEEPTGRFVTLQTEPYDEDGKKVVYSVDIPLIHANKSKVIADHFPNHNNKNSLILSTPFNKKLLEIVAGMMFADTGDLDQYIQSLKLNPRSTLVLLEAVQSLKAPSLEAAVAHNIARNITRYYDIDGKGTLVFVDSGLAPFNNNLKQIRQLIVGEGSLDNDQDLLLRLKEKVRQAWANEQLKQHALEVLQNETVAGRVAKAKKYIEARRNEVLQNETVAGRVAKAKKSIEEARRQRLVNKAESILKEEARRKLARQQAHEVLKKESAALS